MSITAIGDCHPDELLLPSSDSAHKRASRRSGTDIGRAVFFPKRHFCFNFWCTVRIARVHTDGFFLTSTSRTLFVDFAFLLFLS